MRIVFFGTSLFAAAVLKSLLGKEEIVAVVTRPDRPRGRSQKVSFAPVKEALINSQASIDLHQPEKASTGDFAAILKEYNADLFLVVAYGEIISQALLDIPNLDCINIHASLLPKYRGAAPMQRLLLDGGLESGITIISMVTKMDAGAMVKKASCEVSKSMTLGELEKELENLACKAVLTVINDYKSGNVTKMVQDENFVTYAPKIASEELKIDWNRSAHSLHNQIRAFSPYPGAWAYFSPSHSEEKKKRIKILRSEVVSAEVLGGDTALSGSLFIDNQDLVVVCKEGALRILEVQVEGKKKLSASDFLRGMRTPFSFS